MKLLFLLEIRELSLKRNGDDMDSTCAFIFLQKGFGYIY